MALGKRPEGRQEELFVAASDIRRLSHPFYRALERLLQAEGFDAFAEQTCRAFYAPTRGRPSIPPGVYFRMLLVGYMEGIGSERGIAWRCADSISLREFLGCGLSGNPPDHSSVSRTRRRLSVEAHAAVFAWVLEKLRDSGLLVGKTLGVDATTLEANAALRSIVRRDDGTGYEDWLVELARASGIDTPTRQDLAKLDRKRPKKGSNEDWVHPQDPEARITKMKDGRTRLAHKLEQAADMDSGAIVAVTVQTMAGGDCASLPNTLDEAERQLAAVDAQPKEAVADKGYHSNATMKGLKRRGLRSYVSEPDRGRRKWTRDPEAQQPTYANRRRIRGNRGKRLLRRRGEKLERGFAHLLETGAMRRAHARGQANILKRMLVHAAAHNLGLLMRARHGVGTPRSLQGLAGASGALARQAATAVYLSISCGLGRLVGFIKRILGPAGSTTRISHPRPAPEPKGSGTMEIGSKTISATGC